MICRGWRHHSLAEAWQGSTAATGPAVLHDLAVCTAEAVALAYLAEVHQSHDVSACAVANKMGYLSPEVWILQALLSIDRHYM